MYIVMSDQQGNYNIYPMSTLLHSLASWSVGGELFSSTSFYFGAYCAFIFTE